VRPASRGHPVHRRRWVCRAWPVLMGRQADRRRHTRWSRCLHRRVQSPRWLRRRAHPHRRGCRSSPNSLLRGGLEQSPGALCLRRRNGIRSRSGGCPGSSSSRRRLGRTRPSRAGRSGSTARRRPEGVAHRSGACRRRCRRGSRWCRAGACPRAGAREGSAPSSREARSPLQSHRLR